MKNTKKKYLSVATLHASSWPRYVSKPGNEMKPFSTALPTIFLDQVYGSNGNLVSGNPRKSGLVANGGQTADDIHFSFVGRYKEAYRLELEHFVDLMTGGNTTSWVFGKLLTCRAASCAPPSIIE